MENTIGIWKGRFPYLRNIWAKIRYRSSMRRVIRYVKATVHNLFVNHEADEDWVIPEDNSADKEIDETLGTEMDKNGETRREQIHNYLDLLLN